MAELKEVVAQSKEKQKEASAECKRLEKEMADFKNNKDSKLNEIKVCHLSFSRRMELMNFPQADIVNKKKSLGKQTLQVKTNQKAVQTAELELRESPIVVRMNSLILGRTI